ncbi:hypothetical protein [Herbiconiux sp. L3-i23]|uniref:hypothetical protein n=1 Tax=Herbiconiux sp. L3-i23 TaxID=2905871 RepID=UPI00206C7E70|nr:hypothetical protein [Herbiconiux sp. L3-i23]BDI22124.1 hypothetical protein L3i23_09000 [Herbiconiux sp. L3-i23]
MSTESQPNPAEKDVEHDFSIPEDADFTTPGNPIENDEHVAEEVDDEVSNDDATPGNPLER